MQLRSLPYSTTFQATFFFSYRRRCLGDLDALEENQMRMLNYKRR